MSIDYTFFYYLNKLGGRRIYFSVFIALSPGVLLANTSSFDDLIREVANEQGLSRPEVEGVTKAVFKRIRGRMLEDKGTSIPEFGRFTVSERMKSAGKDKDGYSTPGRLIRSPRFSFAKELKTFMDAGSAQ